jgi:environmental stress-induced protein Ves
MSVADVDRNGPFSLYQGLFRILTVIEGDGLQLTGPDKAFVAALGKPVRFDGALAIDCELIAGPVRDFNLIFDSARISISVTKLCAGRRAELAKGETPMALLPIGAPCLLAGDDAAPPGSVLLFEAGDQIPKMVIADGGMVLFVTSADPTGRKEAR